MKKLQLKELSAIARDCGIAGAGGAGFPTYAKLDKRADTVICNCAECEPLFRVHRQLLAKYAREIVGSLCMIAEVVEAKRVIVALKPSYREAREALEGVLSSYPNTEICLLPEVYPAGDEVVLIYEATGRVVPPGDIPISVGVTVFNVETLLNLWDAVENGAPVTHKYVMVAGEVEHPVTVRVPLGMTLKDVVEKAGKITTENPVYISGGPMTGRIANPYETVTKTTNAVIILPENHSLVLRRKSKTTVNVHRAMSACCSCRMCTDLCPRHQLGHPIEPHEFMNAVANNAPEKVNAFLNTMYCSQCGLCEMYACGQGLSPASLIGTYKNGLRAKGITVTKQEASNVAPERPYRKVSLGRLTARLGLSRYNKPAPIVDETYVSSVLRLPLQQHIGAPSVPTVKPGDWVAAGQEIGMAAEGKLSLPLHTPITGVVKEVGNDAIVIQMQS